MAIKTVRIGQACICLSMRNLLVLDFEILLFRRIPGCKVLIKDQDLQLCCCAHSSSYFSETGGGKERKWTFYDKCRECVWKSLSGFTATIVRWWLLLRTGNSNVWSRFITESHPLATDRCDGFPTPPLMDSPTEYTTGQEKQERIKAKGLAGVDRREKWEK